MTRWFLLATAASALCFFFGCGSDVASDSGPGGGTTASGGTTATGGTTASGGSGGAAGGGLPDGACNDDDDCTGNGEYCAPPGATHGCGFCEDVPDPCADDAACKGEGDHYICAPVLCPCDESDTMCQPGCKSSDECSDAQECGPTNRCQPKFCMAEADCPEHYECNDTSKCARKLCSGDGECGGGYCVLGACYATPGECSLPAA